MYIYIGTFLIAFSTLAFEVTLTRLLSVITWYHLAFFAISTAMLGMTTGAITVYVKPAWFQEKRLRRAIAWNCFLFGISIPFSLILLCRLTLPVSFDISGIFHLFILTLTCSIPFYFFGVAIAAILTKESYPIGRLYASDLLGAALGALFVLVGLEWIDAPSLILFCGALGAVSGLFFVWREKSVNIGRACLYGFLVLTAAGLFNMYGDYRIRPLIIKGKRVDPSYTILDRWNSHSHVVVYPKRYRRANLWGPSPRTPDQKTQQFTMKIDGDAGTVVRQFSTMKDIDHLRWDVTNVVYYLRPGKSACIIGVGGGKDIHSAILFGMKRIVGIDVNPIFIDLQKRFFRDFANIANRSDVTLIVDEARSALSRMKEKFTTIQMALIDTWAATGAGAFSLSENGLYTVEAWQIFFNRLADDGIFTVSRWYNPNDLSEAGRTLALTVAALLDSGEKDPSSRIIMVTSGEVATLLVSKKPFREEDIKVLESVCEKMAFNPVILPGKKGNNSILEKIVRADSSDALKKAIDGSPLNLSPTWDSNPFFFNQLRFSNLLDSLPTGPGVIRGNRIAIAVLLGLIFCLVLLALATIVVPLVWSKTARGELKAGRPAFWSGALYFSLIGAGFMFCEIALIQRLSIFLGHPVYSLGILLFTMIASTGIGSFLSEYLPLTRRPWMFVYPALTVLVILLVCFGMPVLMTAMQTASMGIRILTAVSFIGPLGVVLGLFFPTGMRLVKKNLGGESPWYWALNGIFGVLCSAVAILLSIFVGIYFNLYLAAGCYAATIACLYQLEKKQYEKKVCT